MVSFGKLGTPWSRLSRKSSEGLLRVNRDEVVWDVLANNVVETENKLNGQMNGQMQGTHNADVVLIVTGPGGGLQVG